MKSRFEHSQPVVSSAIGTRLVTLIITLTILCAGLPTLLRTVAAAPVAPTATVITVDTSADLTSSSGTRTCTYSSGALFVPAVDGCTLRRALLEAAARPQSDRPITIQFNLAANDPSADQEVSGTWTLPVADALPKLRTDTILNLNGQVTIDGATQPGGRSAGPKIIIATNDNSLEIESENNVIRNLAFKGGGVIFLKENGNTVENIWMGLRDDGQSIVFRTGQAMRMAGGGIHIAADNNIVRNNVIAGAFARAIDIDGGDNNLVENNLIGTRADGTVPAVPPLAQCLRSLNLDPQNWYGGWGIVLSGSNNQILGNRIAGLHIIQTQNSTPPMAIEIFGANHEIRDNIIGVDSAGNKVGVCGQGIKVSGSGTQIIDNVIVGSRTGFEDGEPTAILASDTSPLFGQITVRGNLVEAGPGKVYEFGPGIPSVLRTFAPAKITDINGVNVTGANGTDSPCPGCLIDLYADNDDAIGETLVYLGSATADNAGNFTFTLSQPLVANQGLRTSSTTSSAGVIGSYLAGTTTKFSKLYLPMTSLTIEGPSTGEVGITYAFTVTVGPAQTTAPFAYTIAATDAAPQTLSSNSRVIVGSYGWTQPGVKTINVTVENELGTLTATKQLTIAPAVTIPAAGGVYLPLVHR